MATRSRDPSRPEREHDVNNAFDENEGHQHYEHRMQAICDVRNKKGERIGSLRIKSITPRAADKYAKRTAPRILAATRKRRAHVLANTTQTEFQNGASGEFQNNKIVKM